MRSFSSKLQNFTNNYKISFLIYISYLLIIFLILFLFNYFKVVPYVNETSRYIDFLGWFCDASLYNIIALFGYKYPLYAFFPGYPMLLKFLLIYFPLNFVSQVNFILTLFTVLSLTKFLDLYQIKPTEKYKTLILFLAYPTSFFLISNYTESFYILIASWCLYFLIKKNYPLFFFFGFLLSFVKITAICLPLVYFAHLIHEKNLNFKLNLKSLLNWFKFLAASIFLSLGLFIYFGMMKYSYNNPWLFFESQKAQNWERDVLNLKLTKVFADPSTYFVRISELSALFLLVFLVIIYQKKLKRELLVFSMFHFLIPVISGTLMSLNRLSLLCFPLLLFFFRDLALNKKHYYLVLMLFIIWQFLGIYGIFNFIFVG